MTEKRKLRPNRLVGVVALVLVGCSSAPTANEAHEPRAIHQTCGCGTPEHDVLGCTHECCRGGPSCGNPLCVCPTFVQPGRTKTRGGDR